MPVVHSRAVGVLSGLLMSVGVFAIEPAQSAAPTFYPANSSSSLVVNEGIETPVETIDLAGDAIRLSGLNGLAEQVRNVAQQVLNLRAVPIGRQYDVAGSLAQRWAPLNVQRVLRSEFDSLNDVQQQDILTALEAPSVERARTLELEAIASQSSAEFRDYMSRLRTQAPAASRLALIEQLDNVQHFSSMMVLARNAAYPVLQEHLKDWQPTAGWAVKTQTQTREFLFYVHRHTSNEQLRELITQWQAPALQQWLQQLEPKLSAL
ncbi:MAG: hypothetical protein KBT79_02810 [Thalassolituus oleivorans]|nr:hypothetical protein [Thalassolituus oleivorans]